MELAVIVADKIFVMRNSNLVERAAFSGDYSVLDVYKRQVMSFPALVKNPFLSAKPKET